MHDFSFDSEIDPDRFGTMQIDEGNSLTILMSNGAQATLEYVDSFTNLDENQPEAVERYFLSMTNADLYLWKSYVTEEELLRIEREAQTAAEEEEAERIRQD